LSLRTFLSAALVLLVAVSVDLGSGWAQRREPFRIGVLTDGWGPTPATVGLRDGLQALGYREGEEVHIGVRFTQGNIGVIGLPTTFLIARDGRAVARAIGPRDWAGSRFGELLRALLHEPVYPVPSSGTGRP